MVKNTGFKRSLLHVLNYSLPINKKVKLEELKEHIYKLRNIRLDSL